MSSEISVMCDCKRINLPGERLLVTDLYSMLKSNACQIFNEFNWDVCHYKPRKSLAVSCCLNILKLLTIFQWPIFLQAEKH